MVNQLTLGKLRNTTTNRQIKILGPTHRRRLKAQYNGQALKDQIEEFENLEDLIDGDLTKLKKVTRDQIILTDNEINKLFADIANKKDLYFFKFKLTDGTVKHLAGTNLGLVELRKILKSNYSEAHERDVQGSDTSEDIKVIGVASISLIKLKKPKKIKKNKAGGYFKYINDTCINLTKYQIVKETDDHNILNENCLIYAFKQYGVSDEKINRVKLSFTDGAYIAKNKIKQISDMLKMNITLYSITNDNANIKKQKYGKYDETIEIAIHSDHFFLYEETIYSPYASKHYNELKDINNFHKIIKLKKGKPEKSNKYKGVNSLQLIDNLFKQGVFNSKSTTLTKFINQPEITIIQDIPLSEIESEQRIMNIQDEKETPTDVFYADTE